MKVRIPRRIWVVLMVDRKNGFSLPRWMTRTLKEARRISIVFNAEAGEGWGYWACVVPFRYDELGFIKRRVRKRIRKQRQLFQEVHVDG